MANLRADNLCGSDGRNAIDGSLFFDDRYTRLDLDGSSDLAFGTGDFTIEMWIKIDDDTNTNTIYDSRPSGSNGAQIALFYSGSGNAILFAHGGSVRITGTVDVGADQAWHHIALTRASGSTKLFVDGVQDGSTYSSDTTDYLNPANRPRIGSSSGSTDLAATSFFKGYISNVRVNKGTALYTANFTPPTEKLIAIDGTVLLCCQDSDDPTQEATGKTITGYGTLGGDKGTGNLITNALDWDGAASSQSTDMPTNWTAGNGAEVQYATGGTSGGAENRMLRLYNEGGNNAYIYQTIPTVIGQKYQIDLWYEAENSGLAIRWSAGTSAAATTNGYAQWTVGTNGDQATQTGSFIASATTTYITFQIISGTDGASVFVDDIQVKAFNPKAPKVLPSVGVDEGVTFGGETKHNTQGYMYFPTGDTSQRSRGLAVFGGGITPSITALMDYCHIPTMGNLIRWGELTASKNETSAFSSSTRGVWAGGTTGTYQNVIESMEFATQAEPTDFGDLTVARGHSGGTSNSTRGLVFGGYDSTPNPDTLYNTIDYVTIPTKGNAQDFGDASETGWPAGGSRSSTTRAVTGGYATPSNTNTIDYVTIATTGNAANFGDLTHAGYGTGAGNVSNGTRAVFLGNSDGPSNTIDYITIASTGNATDFGDLTAARRGGGSSSTLLRGILVGGRTPSEVNTIDYITIATTGNGSDFGDSVSQVSFNHAGCSDSHGGLS